jgi:hypothetical protein
MSELNPAVEYLAERVHAAWVQAQVAAGFVSRISTLTGEEMMVAYERLSERVKDLDRGSVRAVLAAIEDSPYVLVEREPPPRRVGSGQPSPRG